MNHRAGYLYLAGLVSFVAPTGIQTVLFPWLVVVLLQETPERLGLAQMSLQAPIMFLIIAGGILADRFNRAHILSICHLLAAVPPLVLSVVIAREGLSYGHLIAYGISIGLLTAFVQPARDGMLSEIAGTGLQRAVTLVMGLSFGGQLIGFVAGGLADSVGPVFLLQLQAVIIASGAFVLYPLSRVTEQKEKPHRLVAQDTGFWIGLRLVRESFVMRPVTLFVFLMSFMYGGAYAVLVPLMARDVFAGGAEELAQCFIAFVLGTVTMTLILVSRPEIKRPMNAMLHGLVVGGACLVFGSLASDLIWFLVAIFAWGMCGTIPMSMSRSIIQSAAPDAYRARVLAVYSLANLGGMPLGAAYWGVIAGYWGPQETMWIVAGTMASIVLLYRGLRARQGPPELQSSIG
jgi:MFS family permease